MKLKKLVSGALAALMLAGKLGKASMYAEKRPPKHEHIGAAGAG